MTYKWKRDSCHRQRPQYTSNVHKGLKTYKRRQSCRAKLGKHITRLQRSANTSDHKDNDSQHNDGPSCETSFLRDGRVYILRVSNWNHFGIPRPKTPPVGFTGCTP